MVPLTMASVGRLRYPGDKDRGTMWITGGKISSYTANRIFYMNDTKGGRVGALCTRGTVATWPCLAFTPMALVLTLLHDSQKKWFLVFWNSWIAWNWNHWDRLHSPMCMFGVMALRVTKFTESGGGTVNCQYKPPGPGEKFYICPVEVTPSLAAESHYKVEIQSASFSDVFIRLDGRGMSHFDGNGGGLVNCQYTASTFERFYLQRESNGSFSFRSVQFLHCYIRLDGEKVNSWSGSGGGTVNCQWYDTPPSPTSPTPVVSHETFYVEEEWTRTIMTVSVLTIFHEL